MCKPPGTLGQFEDPAAYRARVIRANREGFSLWKDTCKLIEDRILAPRTYPSPFEFSLDVLFLQAYKSFCAVYLLAVRGQEEDAATVLRRLMEITIQVEYLVQPEECGARVTRAERYLAHDPDKEHYWWGAGLRKLFEEVGRGATYEQDYSLLSQIAHAVSRRVIPNLREGVIKIRTAEVFTPLLVFAARYVLSCCYRWNQGFHLISEPELEALVKRATEFPLRPISNVPESGKDV